MSLREGLEEQFGNVDYERFESEVERIRDEVKPPLEAVQYADEAMQKWGLPVAERELIAIERTFFVIKPQSDEIKRSYIHLFSQGAEQLMFGGGAALGDAVWRLRAGMTGEQASQLAQGTFSPQANQQIAKFAYNFGQTFFNIENEYILADHNLAARHILYEPLD